jgi:autotransporter-associated beta strand protein
LGRAYDVLIATRPTAVNLRWALDLMRAHLAPLPSVGRRDAAFLKAAEVAEEDVAANHALGLHGLNVLQRIARRRGGEPLRILTHCNAGRLATVAWGTATAPMYLAHDHGIPIHVLVSETRPRNQGASLTANVATTFSGAVTFGTELSIAGPAGVTLSGPVAGSFALSKAGTGTLILTGANTYSGGTNVTGGVLQFGVGGTAGALPAGAVAVSSGAELRLNRNDTTITVANALSGAGTVRLLSTGASGVGGACRPESGAPDRRAARA